MIISKKERHQTLGNVLHSIFLVKWSSILGHLKVLLILYNFLLLKSARLTIRHYCMRKCMIMDFSNVKEDGEIRYDIDNGSLLTLCKL